MEPEESEIERLRREVAKLPHSDPPQNALTADELIAMTESRTYRLYTDAWAGFSDWWDWWDKKQQREEWERGGCHGREPAKHGCIYAAQRESGDASEGEPADNADPLAAIVNEEIHQKHMRESLRHLAVQGRMWGMNVDAVDDFMRRVNRPDQCDFEELKGALQHFFHQYQDESEARFIREKQERKQPAGQSMSDVRADPIAVAIALKKDHPEWSDRKIAKAVGCAPSTLSRDPLYRQARVILNGTASLPPKGRKDAHGNIEAYEDCDDSDDD